MRCIGFAVSNMLFAVREKRRGLVAQAHALLSIFIFNTLYVYNYSPFLGR